MTKETKNIIYKKKEKKVKRKIYKKEQNETECRYFFHGSQDERVVLNVTEIRLKPNSPLNSR